MTLLRAENIVKRYGATEALKRVSFDVHAGAVNVLIGENGAGKSTLMKILAGVETPTEGQLTMDGKPVQIRSVKEACDLGISIVHQELNLCPNLSVAENIFLTRHKTIAGLLNKTDEREKARTLLRRLEQDIDPDMPVGNLRIGQQQIVEIARALADNARVLILDEPTSALSPTEVEILFRIIRDLKSQGTGIVYISHRLEELLKIGDNITVLRDGSWQATAAVQEVSVPWIVSHMLGRDAKTVEPRPVSIGVPLLCAKGLTLKRPGGGYALGGVDLEVRSGEIVGIYGLLGAGRSELVETLAGLHPRAGGSVQVSGKDITRQCVAGRVENGLCLVPEDRKAEGLFPNLSVGRNIELSSLRKFANLGLLSFRKLGKAIDEMVQGMGVKTSSPDLPVLALSGGNQQKVVIGRCLMGAPKVLLIDEPARGVDIGARHDIFERMRELANDGMCIVFTTSDMAEAISLSDRVLVMSRGQITAELSPAEATEAALIAAANSTLEPIE